MDRNQWFSSHFLYLSEMKISFSPNWLYKWLFGNRFHNTQYLDYPKTIVRGLVHFVTPIVVLALLWVRIHQNSNFYHNLYLYFFYTMWNKIVLISPPGPKMHPEWCRHYKALISAKNETSSLMSAFPTNCANVCWRVLSYFRVTNKPNLNYETCIVRKNFVQCSL